MTPQGGGGIHFPLGSAQTSRPEELRLPPTSKRAIDPAVLAEPVTILKGVGPATAAKLKELGIVSLGDLLCHLPFRYETAGDIISISSMPEGEKVVIRGRVTSHSLRRSRNRRLTILEALIRDNSGAVRAVWYNQGYLQEIFESRPEILARGTLRRRGSDVAFQVEGHEILNEGETAGLHTVGIIPVYPSTGDFSVRRLRSALAQAVRSAVHMTDPLPSRLVAANRMSSRASAVVGYHFPLDLEQARAARKRLAYEELVLLQLALLMRRQDLGLRPGWPLSEQGSLSSAFVRSLPYQPTSAQVRVISEIETDIVRSSPMSRLLQGDVGSGKTMVATYCLLRAVETEGQAALLVPTEVLADQHAERLRAQLEPLGVEVGLLKGSHSAKQKKMVMESLAGGELEVVVGTHSLLQEGMQFADLRMVVVDEQHRFGVQQRRVLTEPENQGWAPHVLHMTATPIPRTLSLTAYGDLDVSTIDELPAGRMPVETRLLPETERRAMWAEVRRALDAGQRAYVVCPAIEDGGGLSAASVRETYAELQKGELRKYRLEMLHGRMSAREKTGAMESFTDGEADVLVSTTVIEVGVDVQEATVMVIEGAWRFGLSQLHQLRGRVGRGEIASKCLLPIPLGLEAEARDRLSAFVRTPDGFHLAEEDLRRRGEGQLFGERQSGLGDLRVARLLRDRGLLELARREARILLDADQGLERPENQVLGEMVEDRFGASVRWLDRA